MPGWRPDGRFGPRAPACPRGARHYGRLQGLARCIPAGVLASIALWLTAPALAAPPAPDLAALTRDLPIAAPGAPVQHLGLKQAMAALHVPSVSVALIDRFRIAGAAVWGRANTRTLYQAASLSKLVAAVAALRLVRQGRLALDRDVNAELTGWHLPESPLTQAHKVTLRGLLSMTGGVGVPGYPGYPPGATLPDPLQILDGAPPASSLPVRVVSVPGTRYAYSGGGYQIVQALIADAARRPFGAAMQALALHPAGMNDSVFAQPLPASLAPRAAHGHLADGSEVPGGWRVVPELAAGGLWSTPTDLARLLALLARAWRGEANPLLDRATARQMFTRQNGGPYGLGGAVAGSGRALVLMKRGQNIGYQGYALIFPAAGRGMVVLTNSDNGTVLATALIRRAAALFHWPHLGTLAD